MENYEPSKEVINLINHKLSQFKLKQTITNLFEITDHDDRYYNTMSAFLIVLDHVYLKKSSTFEITKRFEHNIDIILQNFSMMIELVSNLHEQLLNEWGENQENKKHIYEGIYLSLAYLSLGRIRDIFANGDQYLLMDIIDDELGLGQQIAQIDGFEVDSEIKTNLTEKVLSVYNKVKLFENVMQEGKDDQDEDEDDDFEIQNQSKGGYCTYFEEKDTQDLFEYMSETLLHAVRLGNISVSKDFEYSIHEINYLLLIIKEKWLHNQDFSGWCEGFMVGMIPHSTVVDDLMSWTHEMLHELIQATNNIGYKIHITTGLLMSAYQIILDRLRNMSFAQKFNGLMGPVPCLGNFIEEISQYYTTKKVDEQTSFDKILMTGYSDFKTVYDTKNDIYHIVVESEIYYEYLVNYLTDRGASFQDSNTLPILVCINYGMPPLMVWQNDHFKQGIQIGNYVHDMRMARIIFNEFDSVGIDEVEFTLSLLKICNMILSEENPEIDMQPELFQRMFDTYGFCSNIQEVAGIENMNQFAYMSSIIGGHLSDQELQTYYHQVFQHLYESNEIRVPNGIIATDQSAIHDLITRRPFNPN